MTQTPTDALRLVPCPFCGGDVINTRSQEMTEGPAYYWHKCETCGAESEGDYGEDVAVAAWNRRAAPASPLPGGGWQDISTAPRTGEEFQAWWKGTWQPRARFDPEYGSFQLWGRTDFDTEGWEVFEIDGFWQPQPAAPTGDA